MAIGDTITKSTTDAVGAPILQTSEVVSEEPLTNYLAVYNSVRATVATRLELPDATLDDVATLVAEAFNSANLIAEDLVAEEEMAK